MTDYINRLSEIECPTCHTEFDVLTIDVDVRYAADYENSQSYDIEIKCQNCKTIWYHAEQTD